MSETTLRERHVRTIQKRTQLCKFCGQLIFTTYAKKDKELKIMFLELIPNEYGQIIPLGRGWVLDRERKIESKKRYKFHVCPKRIDLVRRSEKLK